MPFHKFTIYVNQQRHQIIELHMNIMLKPYRPSSLAYILSIHIIYSTYNKAESARVCHPNLKSSSVDVRALLYIIIQRMILLLRQCSRKRSRLSPIIFARDCEAAPGRSAQPFLLYSGIIEEGSLIPLTASQILTCRTFKGERRSTPQKEFFYSVYVQWYDNNY